MLEVFRREQGNLTPVGILTPETTLTGFTEQGDYLIRVDERDARLYVDDAPLPTDPLGGYWLWSPDFYSGLVQFELERSEHFEPLRFSADVSPNPNKSGREQYLEYVSQIADYAPVLLLGTEPSRSELGGASRERLSDWIRYARLRMFIDDYLLSLRAVIERPLVKNRHFRDQIPVHLARQVDATTVRRLERNPALLMAIAGGNYSNRELSITDNRLDIPFNEPSFDHPANRLITQQLHRVLRMVSHLAEQFSRYRQESSDTETDILPRMPRRIAWLNRTKKQLIRITRQEPFSAVPKKQTGVAAINAVAGLPHYGRGHAMGLRILKEGISGVTEDEHHYLTPTWQVYEAWCFTTLAQHLEAQLPNYTWKLESSAKDVDMLLSGHNGDNRIRFYSQLRCPSLETLNRYGYYSISRERRPDLILEYATPVETRFVCLDSKYTAHRSGILDSMASAHIYNDSIKHETSSPDLSLLLVPANEQVPQLAEASYITRHHVGCVTLHNPNDVSDVMDYLLQQLGAVE